MSDGRKRCYWDACVFLSYINKYPDRIADLDALLAEAAKPNGELEIVTSVVSIVEVAFGIQEQTKKALDTTTEARIDQLWTASEVVRLVEFHEAIAREARGLMRLGLPNGWRLKPNDAIHLATAKRVQVAEFHTYGTDLDRYAELVGFKICQPYITQGQLPFPS